MTDPVLSRLARMPKPGGRRSAARQWLEANFDAVTERIDRTSAEYRGWDQISLALLQGGITRKRMTRNALRRMWHEVVQERQGSRKDKE